MGARLVEVITQAGIGFRLARVWPQVTRAYERQLKNWHGASQYCPICQHERKTHGPSNRRGDGDREHTASGERAARDRASPLGAASVPTRGVTPGQAREFLRLNPSFARPVSASLAVKWGRVRGREEIEALGPRATGARFEENQQLSQQRVTAITRRAVQARLQARQRQLDQQAEQTRARAIAARTHQRLAATNHEQGRAGGRTARRGRVQPTSTPREGGHER